MRATRYLPAASGSPSFLLFIFSSLSSDNNGDGGTRGLGWRWRWGAAQETEKEKEKEERNKEGTIPYMHTPPAHSLCAHCPFQSLFDGNKGRQKAKQHRNASKIGEGIGTRLKKECGSEPHSH